MTAKSPKSVKTTKPSLYDILAGGYGEFTKIIGATSYIVRVGPVNPHLLKLEPVDGNAHTGNPRFWTIHKMLSTEDNSRGPLTEEDQIAYLIDPDLGHGRMVREFTILKDGLRTSGESQDELHVMFDGTVVEGNRRKVACCMLNEENPETFKTVRVVCYPPDVSKQDIVLALGRMHVAQKSRWDSGDKSEILSFLEESGMSPETIAQSLGMRVNAVKLSLEAGKIMKKYQVETGDFRPDKFTVFYKVAHNRKLHKMMLLQKDDKRDDTYDDGLWVRFSMWVKDNKINDCRDIAHMTSEDVGLLNCGGDIMKVIDQFGTTEAINRVKATKSKRNRQKVLISLEDVIAELAAIKATEAETLMQSPEFSDKLRELRMALDTQVARLTTRWTDEMEPAA